MGTLYNHVFIRTSHIKHMVALVFNCGNILLEISIFNYMFSDERVIGSKAVVIQGNYSMILCVGEASSCPESIRNAAGELQMVR